MMKLAYPPPSESPPIIQAFSKDEIANQLLSLQDVIILKEKGTSSRNWILNNHEPVKLAHWYMREIKKVLDKSYKFEQIITVNNGTKKEILAAFKKLSSLTTYNDFVLIHNDNSE